MEIGTVTSCTENLPPIGEWGLLSLLHLAEYGDEAAIAELERRKALAGK